MINPILPRRFFSSEAPLEFGRNDDSGVSCAGFPAGPSGEFDTGHTLQIRRAIQPEALGAWGDGHALQYVRLDEKNFDGYVARLDFRLKPELPLTVRVTEPGGRPVPGAEVGLGGAETLSVWLPYPAAWTDDAGLARVEHMDAKPWSHEISPCRAASATTRRPCSG